ncbi:hypothetical protein RND81_14G162400, partial [Saponaria officinalis]
RIEKKMVKKSKKTESTPKSKIEKRKCKQVEEIAYESNKKLKENHVKELESSKNKSKGILKWVIQAFNHNSFMFKASSTKEFILSKDDIHDFFMLPREGRRVEFTPIGHSKAAAEEPLKEEWRKRFGLGGTTEMIKITQLSQRIKDTVDSGDEFKRLFVLYTMSTFLALTSNHNLDFKLLNAVQDVAEIRNFNWCQYIFDELVKAVADFKGGCKFLCGCTMFLVLAYLHRIEFRGEVQPTELPLIKHWTDTKLKKRVDDEKVVGYLGDGYPTKTNYPICLQKHEPVTEASRKEDGRRGTFINVFYISSIDFIVICSYFELYNEAVTVLVQKYMYISLIHWIVLDIHLLFLEMKRDSDLFHARNVERMKIFQQKVGSGPDIHEKSKESSSTPLVKRSKHAKSLDIPSFEEFEELIHAYNKALDEEQHNSAKENASQGNNIDSLDDIIINIANDVEKTTAKEKRTLSKRTKSTKDKNLEVLRSSKSTRRRSLRYIAKHGIQNDETTVSPQLHDNIGCLLDCGEPNDDIVLLSEYMIENKELMKPVLQLRKEVIDYCYLLDHNYMTAERLATYGLLHFVSKEDAKSMMSGQLITTSIIDCWSIMLNELISKRVVTNKPSRIYFGINHMEQLIGILTAEDDKREGYVDEIFKAWKGWENCCKSPLNLDAEMENLVHCNLEAELIFIPLYSGRHYFCICVNMTEEIIEVLDNQIHKSWKDSTVYNIARVVSGILSDYLEMKGRKDADKLTKFTINETMLPWRTADANDEESGCFLMMHMIAYEGEPYTSELGRKIKRRIFCAEMAAALVLADINEKRAEITKKVNSFTSGK